jgi:hypothetical protein
VEGCIEVWMEDHRKPRHKSRQDDRTARSNNLRLLASFARVSRAGLGGMACSLCCITTHTGWLLEHRPCSRTSSTMCASSGSEG